MKSYRVLVLMVLCVSIAAGWFSLARSNATLTGEYDSRLAAGRAAAEIGATREVQEQMRAALAIRPSFEVANELAVYLRDNAPQDMYVDELEKLVAGYPNRPEGYEMLVAAHTKAEEWPEAYAVLEAAAAREVVSTALTTERTGLAYRYRLAPTPYPEITPYTRYDVATILDGSEWAYVNAKGTTLDGRFDVVSPYWNGERAVVVEGLPRFVDDKGQTTYVATRAGYAGYGIYADGLFDATLKDGTATFLTDAFRPAFGDTVYEEVTTFVGGLAGAKQGGAWSVLDRGGKVVGSGYAAVAVDESRILVGQDRYFAKVGESFQMFDMAGSRVGDGAYEDARPFDASGPAAVKVGGDWGFVGTDGSMVVAPAFEDARSFANGLAAVRTGGLWGYVDSAGKLVIPATFRDATRFSSEGTALVLTDAASTPAMLLDLDSPTASPSPDGAATPAPTATGTAAADATSDPAGTPADPGATSDPSLPTTPAPGEAPRVEETPGWRLLELVRFK
ncbi:WG repeat-containing protein [Sanguibacter sp. HDW7]|uniref:WG repeat-containing protein n=1 Tax=Sanguibacter sp. HDW7 TaxID=2714931 RepID=UPI00140B1FEF|nr:WG repeat-containing protein [Sanguibacter sp. HDW7]QIK82721.1 WG repeat-containing protein [Sanguibacter sp. HDW7]